MNLFETAYESLLRNQNIKKAGKDIAIPFGFERLDKVHPGIIKGTYTLISSLQKTGKTNLANYLYIINLIDFIHGSKTNIKAKVFMFSLEMTAKQLMHQLMCHRLYKNHGIRIDVKRLNSLFKGEFIDDNTLKLIKEDKPWFDTLEQTIEIIENIKNPFGIYSHVKKYMENPTIGEFTSEKEYNFTDENGKLHKGMAKTNYIMKDPDLYVFVIVDNYNNLTPEKGGKLYDAIGKFSGDYAITLRNIYQCNIVAIQQQAAEGSSNDAYKLGKLEPSVENLKDFKSTANDIDMFITLYSPLRNKLKVYEGYDINKLGDHYRRFSIQLDRNGQAVDTDLFFDGATNTFKQMPLPEDKVNLEKVYNLIKKFNEKGS